MSGGYEALCEKCLRVTSEDTCPCGGKPCPCMGCYETIRLLREGERDAKNLGRHGHLVSWSEAGGAVWIENLQTIG